VRIYSTVVKTEIPVKAFLGVIWPGGFTESCQGWVQVAHRKLFLATRLFLKRSVRMDEMRGFVVPVECFEVADSEITHPIVLCSVDAGLIAMNFCFVARPVLPSNPVDLVESP